MAGATPERIRTVALVGHTGTGKTTLAEALLHQAGVTSRMGSVDDGTTVSDTDPEELARHQSLRTSVLPLDWREHQIILLDTPGYADFEHEAVAAMQAADLAVFVVSAADGVQVTHRRLWSIASELGLARLVFVNKLDRENARFRTVLADLRSSFGAGVAPLELPIGVEAGFRGVADLLSDTGFVYDAGTRETVPIPEDMAELEHEVHDNLVEGIVVADDSLLERYLEGDVPSVDELEATLAVGVDAAQVFPVLCGSATGRIAVDRLADFLCEIGPSPLERRPVSVRAGDTTVDIVADASADPLLTVFASHADAYVGHVCFCRVTTGTVRDGDHLVNTRTGQDHRMHGFFIPRGREHLDTTTAVAGQIIAVPKLADTFAGDTLAPAHTAVTVEWRAPEEPSLALAVVARTQADDDKLMTALARAAQHDPALRIERNDETHQTLLWGTGEAHLSVTIERLARQFGVTVDTQEVEVAHRETITASGRAEGRYKKQSGGHGQFGVVTLEIEPLERGGGFEFVDQIVGGAIPRQFIPAVEKGVVEALAEGGVHGYPVVDVRVRCVDGKAHSVDSSEMSFKMAAKLAFREAMATAGPVVLEPLSTLEVTVPVEYQGDVLGDLNSRRARIAGTEIDDLGHQVITAIAPTAALTRYAIDLRSLTHGHGRFHTGFDHYDVAPAGVADSRRQQAVTS